MNNNPEKKLLTILYNAQKGNTDNLKELDEFEKEFGEVMFHELITLFNKNGWSNLISKLGSDNHCSVTIKNPILTLNGIAYFENLQKPWWKKLDYKKIILTTIGIFAFALLGIIDRLPHIGEIIDSIQKYILK